MGTFMSKHSNLLKYMPVDDKASALHKEGIDHDLDGDVDSDDYMAARDKAIKANRQ